MISPKPIPPSAGIGLRGIHHAAVMLDAGRTQWFEVHTESFITHSHLQNELDSIARNYPLSLHGAGLSLGTEAAPDEKRLRGLFDLVARYQPGLVSDHLSWDSLNGAHVPGLHPLSYSSIALDIVVRNVDTVQSCLKRRIELTNPSQYVRSTPSEMTEAEFLTEVVKRSGCGVLLDINNIFVSSKNNDIEPGARLSDFLMRVPHDSIAELHLGGHSVQEAQEGRRLYVDDHGARVSDEVWDLFEAAVNTLGPKPTLIEWNKNLPAFEVLQEEADAAQVIIDRQEHMWAGA
jgi:uncharacterized protein